MEAKLLLCGLLALILVHAIAAQTCQCVNGLNGRDGRDGMPGRDGRDCMNITLSGGASGSGRPGRDGARGRDGPQGPRGYRGPQGPKGDRGPPGSGSGGLDRAAIERMVKDLIKAEGGSGTSSGGGSSLKRVTVCSKQRKDVCGSCQCKDKNYADEFFSRGYYCDCQNVKAARDCKEHLRNGNSNDGIYLINPAGDHPFPVFCDMNSDGGGWTVFQRRIDDTVDFKRDWFSYKNGFGNLQHEFWLGLENIFLIQLYDDRRGTEMRMDFQDKDGKTYTEKYGMFEIGDESTKYRLGLAGYNGDAGDWMKDYKNKKFSTYDNDNDEYGADSALSYGAFWHGYGPSYPYNPNGAYGFVQKYSRSYDQPQVKAFSGKVRGARVYLTKIEMKIRRK